MGARFYSPAVSQFMNQDQVDTSAQADPAAGGGLHAYAGDNPVTVAYPSTPVPAPVAGEQAVWWRDIA